MSDIKCKFCGAINKDTNERCFSCNAPLPKRSNLSEKDKKSLSNYIKSINNMLKTAQKKGDSKLIPIFLILSVLAIGSIIGLYFILFEINKILFITLSIIWGLVLFIVFGFFVGKYHNEYMKLEFKTKIKFEIREYLRQMHFSEADFKTVASETLDDEAPLLKFLPEI